MYAKKSLGQHFLHSQKALGQIIEAASLRDSDTVLEIGPGHGVLTEYLLEKAATVIAIEKDHDLIPILEEHFAKEIAAKKLLLIQADILTFDISAHLAKRSAYKLVANIPYYITGAIIERFLSTPHQPQTMVLLMQKEVAERIVSKGGKESILSIAVKAYGTPKLIAKVPPGAFNPPPTVDSAILSIENISRDFFIDCDEATFFTVMKTLFGTKRKQVGGTLSDFLEDKALAHQLLHASGIDPKTRPEDILLATWKVLIQTLGRIAPDVVQYCNDKDRASE